MYFHGISTYSKLCVGTEYALICYFKMDSRTRSGRPETDAVFKDGWLLFHVTGNANIHVRYFKRVTCPLFFKFFLQNVGRYWLTTIKFENSAI